MNRTSKTAMKILLSSKLLASKLKEIDFEKERIERVVLNDGELTLIAQTTSVKFHVHILEFKSSVRQDSVMWDWVRSLVDSVDDQPIVLQIFENSVNVIFQY